MGCGHPLPVLLTCATAAASTPHPTLIGEEPDIGGQRPDGPEFVFSGLVPAKPAKMPRQSRSAVSSLSAR